MVCLNCNNTFESDYCPYCGQAAKTKRLRLTEIVNNFIGSFVGGDNRFLRTCLDLICRPGYMVRDYLNGKRVRYYNPLQLYVFMLTLYAVVSYVLGVSDSIIDDMTNLDLDTDVEASKYASVDFIIKCIAEVGSNKLYGTLVIAFFSSFPYLWFFRKCKVPRKELGHHSDCHLSDSHHSLHRYPLPSAHDHRLVEEHRPERYFIAPDHNPLHSILDAHRRHSRCNRDAHEIVTEIRHS